MGQVYACGQWQVKAGREDEFVSRWQELGDWTMSEMPEVLAGDAKLIQSRSDPTRFVSFGLFASPDALQQWLSSEGYQERQGRVEELLESGDRGPYELRGEVNVPAAAL